MLPAFASCFETYTKARGALNTFHSSCDPIDAFPEHISTTVLPVTLPVALEYAARQGQVRAVSSSTKSPPQNGVFVPISWRQSMSNEFRPNDVMWGKNIERPC
ncbi:hypothetical protein TNCV_3169931 [Trichonephila clavipes]|nr:hypothetical protein TNCV_3169931 [Trichonephila clavipes]